MLAEQREAHERDEVRLKNDWIRTHPEKAKQIEAIFSKKDPDAELSAEEAEYNQVDADTQRVLDDLTEKGFAFTSE